MSIHVFSAALSGIDAKLIEVEVDSNPGIHSFNIVGLPDKAVQESKERIGSSIKNSGFLPPKSRTKKVIVNLAPADVKKEGPAYDLPIAVGYLFETKQVKFNPESRLFAGELALNGRLQPTTGILAMTILAKEHGLSEVIVPSINAKEASVIKGINVIGAETLADVIAHLNKTSVIKPFVASMSSNNDGPILINDSFISIQGQEYAKRALIIAASGGHNMLMNGPPGSGKTLLAKALVDILPSMTSVEAIEVAKIYSSLGLINASSPLSFARPFRNPHHTTSAVAVVGGGSWPRPGEISLAHRGVLFLDELPEFPRGVLESLRQPLEDGAVTIARASGSIKIPAKFMLVAAMNPCPCGNYGSQSECLCLPYNVLKYNKKISGPLLDRIDIQVNVPRETITEADQMHASNIAKLHEIKNKILIAKDIQLARFKDLKIFSNSEMNYKNVEKLTLPEKNAKIMLKRALNKSGMSLRAYHKTLKVARTIADLEESETVKDAHVAEALAFKVRANNELG